VRRALALWLVLFAAYAATLALPVRRGAHTPREARIVVVARELDRDARLSQPVALGLPLLAAPVLAALGVTGLQLLLAAAMALAVALAAVLARHVVPDPWASAAALACGLSPPALATAGAIGPEPLAALLLTGAALCALRTRERPQLRWAMAAGVQLAVLPWLGVELALAGLVIALALIRWLLRRGRGLYALVAGEAVVFSVVACVSVNERIFGSFVPQAAAEGPVTGAQGVGEHAARAQRLVSLWLDRESGMLRWAPVVALAFFGVWLLWRSRRERLAVAVPDRLDAEVAAGLCALCCGAQVAVAAFLAPGIGGPAFPGLHLVSALPLAVPLGAWGLRHAPRVGAALVSVTLATSVWLLIAVAAGDSGLAPPSSRAPLGPLDVILPRFGEGSPWATAVTAGVGAGLLALAVREGRRWRGSAARARAALR
jgi:hypothetical protein